MGLNLVFPRTFLFFLLLWGEAEVFQILHGHTHRMGVSRAEMHGYVTLCCTLHLTHPSLTFCFYSLALSSVCALKFCGSLLREDSQKGTRSGDKKKKEIATVQFEGCTTKQTCSNEAFKFNRIINAGRKLSFNLRHIRSSEIITHLRIFTLHCQDLNKENID